MNLIYVEAVGYFAAAANVFVFVFERNDSRSG